MTDEQLKKALECCNGYDCETCRALKYCDYMHPGALARASLDLINRQKAEIERLKENIDGLNIFTTNQIKVARLQAIKEFAERLKEKCYEDFQETYEMLSPYVTDDDIDNLLKEMEGEE